MAALCGVVSYVWWIVYGYGSSSPDLSEPVYTGGSVADRCEHGAGQQAV